MGRLEGFAIKKVEAVVEKSREQTEKAAADLTKSFQEIIDGQNDQAKALISIYEVVDQNNDMLREISRLMSLAVPAKLVPKTNMEWEE